MLGLSVFGLGVLGFVFRGEDMGGVAISIVVLSVTLMVVVVVVGNDIKDESLATLETHGWSVSTDSVPQQDVLGVFGGSCYDINIFVPMQKNKINCYFGCKWLNG